MLAFSGRIKIGLVFGFRGCYFIDIGLVLVCHFPESGISSTPLTMSLEVGQRAVLEAVGDAFSADGLLTDAGDHLRDVDERA